jgi:hypothetical protein
MGTAAGVARNLGAWRQGHNWRCACPRGCGYALSLTDGEDGAFLAYCFGGCEFEDIVTSLVEHGLLDDDDDAGDRDVALLVKPRAVEDPRRSEAARRIYDRLAPAAGTPVEAYLRSRRITLPVPPTLRFGGVPHRLGGIFPAMAAPIVDVDGDLIGVHMTYLCADGSAKADFVNKGFQRECRGVIRGGAIRLTEHDPERELIVAEGVETTLSAMQVFGLPGWSAVSAGGLKTVGLPATVYRVVIAADNDVSGAGQRNALAAYHRWTAEGRSVRIAMPPIIGSDFNDILAKRA